MSTTVEINGTVIQISGRNNVTIRNGQVIVNGKDVTPNAKEINIVINGPVDKLEVDTCNKIEVTGDVTGIKTTTGNVAITGSVSGSVQTTLGNVTCGDVMSSVDTTLGDVNCGTIAGSVSTTLGDVCHR